MLVLQLIKNLALDILFPPLCLSCNSHLDKSYKHKVVCSRCLDKIPVYDCLFCPVCLARVPEKKHCHPKIRYLLAAATHYDNEIVKKIIWKFKYEGWLSAAEPLLELTKSYLKKLPASGKGFIIIPIPLHKTKEFQRGFNQSFILAKGVSRHLGAELVHDNLTRAKNTKTQKELKDYSEREKNMKGAFSLNRSEELNGQSVILVDDVFTSGATLNEAVAVLKSAGAKKIIALVLARAR